LYLAVIIALQGTHTKLVFVIQCNWSTCFKLPLIVG